jgi:hypothetical protein
MSHKIDRKPAFMLVNAFKAVKAITGWLMSGHKRDIGVIG